jgi:hypothetical protein
MQKNYDAYSFEELIKREKFLQSFVRLENNPDFKNLLHYYLVDSKENIIFSVFDKDSYDGAYPEIIARVKFKEFIENLAYEKENINLEINYRREESLDGEKER